MSEREGSSPASNPGGDNMSLGPEEDSDEFVVRALERAQRVARKLGYTRSTLPSWGLDETRPRRSLDGSSEYAAIETDGLGRLAADDADGAQARAAARAVSFAAALFVQNFGIVDFRLLRRAVFTGRLFSGMHMCRLLAATAGQGASRPLQGRWPVWKVSAG